VANQDEVIKAFVPDTQRQLVITQICRVRNEGGGSCNCGSVCQIIKEIAGRGLLYNGMRFRPILRGQAGKCTYCLREPAAVSIDGINLWCARCYALVRRDCPPGEYPPLRDIRELIGWDG